MPSAALAIKRLSPQSLMTPVPRAWSPSALPKIVVRVSHAVAFSATLSAVFEFEIVVSWIATSAEPPAAGAAMTPFAQLSPISTRLTNTSTGAVGVMSMAFCWRLIVVSSIRTDFALRIRTPLRPLYGQGGIGSIVSLPP